MKPQLLFAALAVVLVLVGTLLFVTAGRARGTERRAVGVAPLAPGASRVEGAEAADDGERTAAAGGAPASEPEVAAAAPPARLPSARPPVAVRGGCVRIDADGEEHTGDAGRLVLAVLHDGRHTRREVAVRGGSFALEAPAGASFVVLELTLAGSLIAPLERELALPADHFLLVRGHALLPVRLHVVSATDGRELDKVEVFATPGVGFGSTYAHPGEAPSGEALVRDAQSPLELAPTSTGATVRAEQRAYWVRARGHAWAPLRLDHRGGGERTLALQPTASLAVSLVGNAPWLEPEVRLWPPDASPRDAYAVAKRVPDEDDRAVFEDLAPGTYVVSVERGWADRRVSFGQATVELTAGASLEVVVEVTPPEAPVAVEVAGTLVLPAAWERADVALVFEGQGKAELWSEGEVVLPLVEMTAARGTGERYEWRQALPVAGDYELLVRPFQVRVLLTVPAGGRDDVELVVPPPADVAVRLVDAQSGAEVQVEQLRWSPPRVEGILATPLLTAAWDAERGCIAFVVPAGEIEFATAELSLELVDQEARYLLTPGPNELELAVRRRIGVRIVLTDDGTPLPWSWDWRLRASGADGARDVARSIGHLWFHEPGVYRLFVDGELPGYASIDGTPFEVRPRQPGEDELRVEVPLVRR